MTIIQIHVIDVIVRKRQRRNFDVFFFVPQGARYTIDVFAIDDANMREKKGHDIDDCFVFNVFSNSVAMFKENFDFLNFQLFRG